MSAADVARLTGERDEARAEVERLRNALAWVGEVYPGRAPAGCATIVVTWAEWNEMRALIDLPPLPRIGRTDARNTINGALRARAHAAEVALRECAAHFDLIARIAESRRVANAAGERPSKWEAVANEARAGAGHALAKADGGLTGPEMVAALARSPEPAPAGIPTHDAAGNAIPTPGEWGVGAAGTVATAIEPRSDPLTVAIDAMREIRLRTNEPETRARVTEAFAAIERARREAAP